MSTRHNMKTLGRPDLDNLTIARPALAVQLADALRELILEGELQAGEKIREKELTLRFGVSRTPLREAMKMLAAEGLIQLVPNRGALVSQQSPEELADAFPVLAVLEGLAGRLAAERASDAELAQIAELTENLRLTQQAGDRPRYFSINQAIHQTILAAAASDTLLGTHATIASRIHRARYQANLTPARWASALAEHEQIAKALLARDADRASQLLHDHMMAKFSSIADRNP